MSVIEKGSLVLVTGANGFIASHIVDQLLEAGYSVRGTVRSEAKGEWLKEYFDTKYGRGKLELVTVPDMAVEGAFNEAVKGASGVVHVASNLTFKPDPNEVIPSVIAGVTNTLLAAETEPKVKRFVFTSSSTAATTPKPNKEFSIDENTWNEETVKAAWAPPPYDGRSWSVYGASKTEAEQALWKFARDRKPHFVVNAVLPNANFGPILSPQNQDASTAGWITELYQKNDLSMGFVDPQWSVDVRDTARLHVAALIDPDVKEERVFAFATPFNWNDVLAIFRKLRPDHKTRDDIDDDRRDLSKVLRKGRAEEILKKNFGRSGFTGLEEQVEANISHLK